MTPMTVAALEQVLAIEVQAYPFPWTRGNFIDSMSSGYHCVCLFDAQHVLLAYVVAMDGVDEVHLLNIAVAPDRQGEGWARLMLDALVARSRTLAFEFVWLEVRPSNERARALYDRYGFEAVGLRRNYYPAAQGSREDAVVMRFKVMQASTQGGTHAVE